MLQLIRDKLSEVDVLRGIAVVAVLIVHMTSSYVNYEKDSSIYIVYGFLNNFLCFAVPMFLFITALILTYKAKRKNKLNIIKFYKKRISKVLIPYIIWVLIYITYLNTQVDWLINPFLNLKEFILEYFIAGKIYYHLYYVPLVIQLYLIFPVLWFFISKTTRNHYYKNEIKKNIHNVTMFALLNVLFILIQYMFIIINKLYIYEHYQYTATLIISYVLPICMGMWIGYNLDEWEFVRKYARIIIYPLFVISGVLYIGNSMNQINMDISTSSVAFIRNMYVTFATLVFFDVARIISEKKEYLKIFFKKISKYSYGIYLSHPFIIQILEEKFKLFKLKIFNNDFFDFTLNFIIKFILILFISYFLTFTIANLRKIWNNLPNKKSGKTFQVKKSTILN